MTSDTRHQNMLENYAQVSDSLGTESDRGAVIIAAAWMEGLLEQAIHKRLVPSAATSDELIGSQTPISTFSAKIELAYRLALISEEARKSLKIVRKLRNDFAHVSNPINFEIDAVRDRVNHLIDLNKEAISAVWGRVSTKVAAQLGESILELDAISAFRRAAGTRYLFDLTAGILVMALTSILSNVERLS